MLTRPVAALAVAGLAWAVPLVADSGGLDGYLRALGTQAGEDFAWVNMLWLDPTPRRLAFALYETFVLPWGSVPLAHGGCRRARWPDVVAHRCSRPRRRCGLLLAFGPYAAFHLLFQETITVRYALPMLPLVAWLAARGFSAAGRFAPLRGDRVLVARADRVGAGGAGVRREPHPAFRAIAAAQGAGATTPPAAVYSHYSLWRALQADPAGLPLVEPRRQYEWLGPVEYWKDGGTGPIWFFADPRRTDLALIDPQARGRRPLSRGRWRTGRS